MVKKIAITGGIGSGKSCVLKIIQRLGNATFSCDEIYKDVITQSEYIQKVAEKFPLVVENGNINRKKLGKIVFSDSKARKQLNDIAHPLIMFNLCKNMESVNTPFVFAEVPLLFEGGYERLFDGIIVVQRGEEDRIKSVCLRDALTEDEVRVRIHAQKDLDVWLKAKKDIPVWFIKNEGDIQSLEERVGELLKNIRKNLT